MPKWVPYRIFKKMSPAKQNALKRAWGGGRTSVSRGDSSYSRGNRNKSRSYPSYDQARRSNPRLSRSDYENEKRKDYSDMY